MPWLQVQIAATQENAEHISDMLSIIGAAAVTLQDSADQPLYEPELGTTPLWQKTKVIGLFDADVDIVQAMDKLQTLLMLPLPLLYRIEQLEDKDWERTWMDHYKPMLFGKRLWICPSWCDIPDPLAINVLLDPGLAFGTGTHPTTSLCLEWLDKNPPIDQSVIDYGCGSGILAIAAAKLGAHKIMAVDNDPQALESTRNNACRNNIDANILQTLLPSEIPKTLCADVIVANILAKPLIELAAIFAQLTCPGSKIALSGILVNQKSEILARYAPWFELTAQKELDGWVRLSGYRK